MKKLIYTFLAVSIIFAACKKEDEVVTLTVVNGCTDAIATNYNALATNDDGTCTFGLVGGAWIPTSEIQEGHITVTMMGIPIMDSTWSETNTDSLEPSKIKFNSDLTWEFTDLDGSINGGVWLQDGDEVTLTEDSAGVQMEIGIFTVASVNKTDLVLLLTFNETEEEDGMIMTYEVNITMNFTRDLNGLTSNTTNQRKSNTLWFNKTKLMNSIKR
jgi:hypothetical protein